MVRYDKCVESLYDRGLIEDKNKSLQMLKVMKGAISMSKSKTGQCIFRTNKLEKKNLERLVKIDKRKSLYNIARVDTGKKTIVGRWMKMLDRQTTCSSQTLLEEALYIREPNSKSLESVSTDSSPRQPEDDGNLKKYLDLRLARDEIAPFMKCRRKEAEVNDDSQNEAHDENGDEGFVTERQEIRAKYSTESAHNTDQKEADRRVLGTTLSKSVPLTLPSVTTAGLTHLQTAQQKAPAEDKGPPALERDLTNWKDWRLKDKNWILGYIKKEKTRHEDLIIRNALVKIETEMSGANIIRRQQIRQKLQVERDEEVRREREQTFEKLNVSDNNRSKSVTSEKTPRQEFKHFRTEVTCTPNPSPERKLSREKSVTFSENVSFQTRSSAVSRPKVCREKTINIVYKEPDGNSGILSSTGRHDTRKTPQYPKSFVRRRESSLSIKLTDHTLPMISEGPTVVSPVGSK